MVRHPVWFPQGSRLEATFSAADLKIAALSGFVCDLAAHLARGDSLAASVRTLARRHPAAAEAFDLADRDDASLDGEFSLSGPLTFPNETLPATISFEGRGATMQVGLDSLTAIDVQELLALCGAARFTREQLQSVLDEPMSALFEGLLDLGIVSEAPLPADVPPVRREPGVTRLQHAGLLYRGREAGVLVDPHLHSSYEPDDMRGNFLRAQFEGLVDAIVISHGHRDHFHLPTLMSFDRRTPIIVPRRSRATMLCPDFAATLRALGFERVITLGWYDPPVSIGDLEVHALPFYGEQPLLHEAPRHPDLRNHGNTYVVRHHSYTSWLLIDSGNDRTGRMADVAHEVKARFGHVDLLLSNLREFTPYTPLYITGAGHYFLSLTAEQMRRFRLMRDDVITLGPSGVAEVCSIVEARAFLPYAHWWGEPGAPPGPDERSLLDDLKARLDIRATTTEILPWRIGDAHPTDRAARGRSAEPPDDAVAAHQRRLLEEVRRAFPDAPIGETTRAAFLAVPRHSFVPRYRHWGEQDWHEDTDARLEEHLAALYADRPLCLFGQDDDPISSISQPSVVLRMLDMVELGSGHVVFELGSGSGWNAALMGHLVGSAGRVYSVEIVPEVAAMARRNIDAFGATNVTIVTGDGAEGYPGGAPFDRVVFTAGAHDLPRHFYAQVKDGGLLFLVVRCEGGGDRSYLLEKKLGHFESRRCVPSGFVPLRGASQLGELEPAPVEELPGYSELARQEVARVPFWWGGGSESFVWRTLGIRCFLGVAEASFRSFRDPPSAERPHGEYYFGLWKEAERSLVVAKDDLLVAYGDLRAMDRLRRRIAEWVELGMPGGANFGLHIYPIDDRVTVGERQWLVKRSDSQFLWTLTCDDPGGGPSDW